MTEAADRRPLATLLGANVISLTGSSLSLIAVPLFVLQLGGSAGKAGVVAFCATLPVAVSAVFGGPVIDRLGRRRVSVGSDLVAAAAMGAIPLLYDAGLLAFWGLCLLVAVSGFILAPGETSRSVLLPHLADRAGLSLGRVAGFYESARQLARLVGAPLAGVLVAVLGPAQVLLLDSVTFLASAVLVAAGLRGLPSAAPVRDAPRVDLARYGNELREGFAFVRRTRLLLAVVVFVMLTNAFNQGWSAVLLPVHAERNLGGSFDFGLISGLTGAGALLGALAYGAFGDRLPRRPVYTAAFLICGLPRFLIAAFIPGLAPLAGFMLLEGAAAGTLNPILTPVLYETVPEHLRSRVQSVTTAGCLAAIPLGALATGYLVDTAGLTAALLAVGWVYLAVTLCPVVFPVWRGLDASRAPRTTSAAGKAVPAQERP